ncbi:MAG: polymer-forming cytoskeletal protein [Acidobacteriota bacterium]|nr:polymer-forming cytoskeletal protein [Acidobacteriota bacterium]
MFNAKTKEHSPVVHSLLGKGTLWKGEIHTGEHSLRIEGTVEGTIHSEGEVTIAPSGLVNGTIHAKHMIATGRAKGVFKILECLEIHGTGCVEGDVEVGSLVVDEGGTLQGTCTRRGMNKPENLPHKPEDKAEAKPETRPEKPKSELKKNGAGTHGPLHVTIPAHGGSEPKIQNETSVLVGAGANGKGDERS